jgi:hypothetical protein
MQFGEIKGGEVYNWAFFIYFAKQFSKILSQLFLDLSANFLLFFGIYIGSAA